MSKVLEGLLGQVDTAEAELRGILYDGDAERTDLTEEQEARAAELRSHIEGLDSAIKRESKAAKRNRRIAEARELVSSEQRASEDGTDVKVENEPMVYGEGSPHSYFLDLARVTAGYGWGIDQDAQERMATWTHQVQREVANDSKFGREAVTQLRGMEGVRTKDGVRANEVVQNVERRGRESLELKRSEMEVRGITTGGGATASAAGGGAAALVTPVFFIQDTAPWREAGRAFIDRCNKQPLPSYGMELYMPRVTGPAGVTTQTEGTGVNETDPSLGFASCGLVTEAGEVTITQQVLDRVGPGFQIDRLLFEQLQRDYNPKVDAYAITQALSGAGQIVFGGGAWAFAAAPGTQSFISKYAGAINTIETTAGTVMSPTHAFLQTSRWNFIESVGALESSSGTLHPLIVPQANGPFNAFATAPGDGAVPYEGYTGYKILGLPVFKDLNIPAPTSGADQAIVANLGEVYVYEGPTVTRAVPQTLANNLQIILQLYAYIGVLTRYPAAVQTITGNGMATITF